MSSIEDQPTRMLVLAAPACEPEHLAPEQRFRVDRLWTEAFEAVQRTVDAMKQIAVEIATDPERVKSAPHTLPVRRPDDVLAARKPILSYRDQVRERVLLAETVVSGQL